MRSSRLRSAVVACLLAMLSLPAGFVPRCCCASAADLRRVERSLSALEDTSSARPSCCRERRSEAAERPRKSCCRASSPSVTAPRASDGDSTVASIEVMSATLQLAGCHCHSNARLAQVAAADRAEQSLKFPCDWGSELRVEKVVRPTELMEQRSRLSQRGFGLPRIDRVMLCCWTV